MQKKFQINDKVKYGSLDGVVDFIDFKNKTIGCLFSKEGKQVYIKFDFEGFLKPCGKFIDNPQLTKG